MYKIKEYVDIKNYSTLKIGGQFRYFVEVDNKADLKDICNFAKNISIQTGKDIPIFILGGGSNMVFSDGVINVIAIKMEIKGFEILYENENYMDIKIGGGENWDNMVEKTVGMNLSGIEALSAIPGTVGASPVQNIGAYGSEVKDTIREVEVFDLEKEDFFNISNKDCNFGYRDSIFKNEAKGKYIIINVTYRLNKIVSSKLFSIGSSNVNIPNYPDVLKYFKYREISHPNLRQIRDAIIYIRNEKLPNPIYMPNVGSFFKNPIVRNKVAEKIKKEFPNLKTFVIDENHIKIPAGWLIENAGLKGKSFGNISVYDKNSLVLINNDNATKDDLIKAKNEIIKIIKDKFNIILEQEPEII